MSRYNYTRFKIRIAPDSGKRQGLHVGDVVRRQYADGTQTFYSLMVVLATGEDPMQLPDGRNASSPYFIGALLDGDAPKDGELLDFVRLSSLSDERRSGALYLTASDEESPYLDVIDGMGTEHSLCRPASLADYACSNGAALECTYTSAVDSAQRILRMTRTSAAAAEPVGLNIPFPTVTPGQRLVISYRVRASKALSGVELSFGYADGSETDGSDSIDISTEWQYKLSMITVDYPETYKRVLSLDLTGGLTNGDWVEIADLNVCLLSTLSSLNGASKIRVGKITGIVDPLFGLLQGYGAYFQRLYATRDVNIAGTLSAGDEAGFGSTFYVGRIHKNCVLDSLNCNFTTTIVRLSSTSPAGIGKNALIPISGGTLLCQTEAWTQKHAGERYCLSFWCHCTAKQDILLSISRGKKTFATTTLPKAWQRIHVAFDVEHIPGEDLCIDLCSDNKMVWFFNAPQLEKGAVPTLYQPTDGTLNETDEYGAWFCRGGVGGTIQHPLLRLEADGSIRAGNNSFVINPDGSGYFSGGAIRWDDSAVTFSEDVKLQWDNLDEETRRNLSGKDSYSVYSDTPSRLFPADSEGRITADHRFDIRFHAFKGRQTQTPVVGEPPQIAGMELSLNADRTGITVNIQGGTSELQESGSVSFPVTVDGVVFFVPFAWSVVRAGAAGESGTELDWVQDWDNNRTQIGSTTLITPKLFAGVKNQDGTVTGTAIGRFALSTKTALGSIVTETVDGICGFKDGYKTFLLDNSGNVQFGSGDQFVRYDAATGKITFGAGVSLNWTTAIDAAKTETLNAAADTAQSKADTALGGRQELRRYEKNRSHYASGQRCRRETFRLDRHSECLHRRCQESRYGCSCRSGHHHLESDGGRLVEQVDLHRRQWHLHGTTVRQRCQRHPHRRLADYRRHHRHGPSERRRNPFRHHQRRLHQRSDVRIRPGHHRRLEHRCHHTLEQPYPARQRQQAGGSVRCELRCRQRQAGTALLQHRHRLRILRHGRRRQLPCPVRFRKPDCRLELRHGPHLQKQRCVGCGRFHCERGKMETQQRRLRQPRFGQHLVGCRR